MSARGSDRIRFRITANVKDELDTASAMLGLSTSDFVKQAALQAARTTITEERQMVLGSETWQTFTATIDRSGEFNEGLAELLRRRSVFTSEQEER